MAGSSRTALACRSCSCRPAGPVPFATVICQTSCRSEAPRCRSSDQVRKPGSTCLSSSAPLDLWLIGIPGGVRYPPLQLATNEIHRDPPRGEANTMADWRWLLGAIGAILGGGFVYMRWVKPRAASSDPPRNQKVPSAAPCADDAGDVPHESRAVKAPPAEMVE